MVFAQLKDGIIQNTIIINDYTILGLFQVNQVTGELYDAILQVDATYPQPGIGWSFDGIQFYPPVVVDDNG